MPRELGSRCLEGHRRYIFTFHHNIWWSRLNLRIFFGKCLKKVVEKFRQKFGPPVSEGLDPLVTVMTRAGKKTYFFNLGFLGF